MTITLLVMDDGRKEYLEQAMASMYHLKGPIARRVIHDDAGNRGHTKWLRDTYPNWEIHSTPARSGFAGAYRNAWHLLDGTCDYVFSTEQDFVFTRDVPLEAMAAVLADRHPHLAQLALRRQPWNDAERAAGGIVEQSPDDYPEHRDEHGEWLEHRKFFTTNPSLIPAWVLQRPWPGGANSEGRFGLALFTDPAKRAGFWGSMTSGEWVQHIGTERVGRGY